jgi:hypothetical protein
MRNETGEVKRTGIMNVHGGPSLTLHQGGLLVERSLPKALRGQNIEDLRQDDVPDALAVVDREVWEALRVPLPPLAEWQPVRVDYCESMKRRDEAEVLRELEKLAGVVLPYKGLPVRGESHGVRWARGAIQPKFYGKYLETKGDPRAVGILRREATTYRLQTFRDLTSMKDPLMTDVLMPEIWSAVWSRFDEPLRGGALTVAEMGDVALLREMVGMFGTRRTASLVGYCVLLVAAGCKTRQDMLASPVMEFRTKYRVMADLRSFRDAMEVKGYDFGPDEASVVPLLGRAAA